MFKKAAGPQQDNLPPSKIVALASSFNLETAGLERYLDQSKPFLVGEQDRMDAALVLSRVSKMAGSKLNMSSRDASGLVSQAAEALLSVAPTFWDGVDESTRSIVHWRLQGAVVNIVAFNDGSLNMAETQKMAQDVQKALRCKGISGDLTEFLQAEDAQS